MKNALVLLSLTLAVGCAKANRPPLAYEVARDQIDLGEVAYDDSSPTGEISLLNTGAIDFVATLGALSGDGAAWVQLPQGMDYTPVAVGVAVTFDVALGTDVGTWVSGAYEAVVSVEVGSFWDDPTTWGEDPVWKSETLDVPVAFTLLCDLDGDGFDSDSCAGDDCDDDDPDTYPGADEAEDDVVDHNCDGVSGAGLSPEP